MVQKLIQSAASLLSATWRCNGQQAARAASASVHNIQPNRTNASQSIDHSQQRTDPSVLLSYEDQKDFFRLNNLFTVEDLFNARVHFGHKDVLLDPHMRPYVYRKRLGVLLFDLDETARLLNKALNVTAEIAYRKGIVLFILNSRQNSHLVEKAALECGEYSHCRRWNDAVFTNSYKLFGTVTRLPDLMVLFSTLIGATKPHKAATTAARMLIPTVGVCDTNSDPRLITYPVPGNDDSPQSIELYANLFKTAVLKGKAKRTEIIEKYGEEFYNKTLDTC